MQAQKANQLLVEMIIKLFIAKAEEIAAFVCKNSFKTAAV